MVPVWFPFFLEKTGTTKTENFENFRKNWEQPGTSEYQWQKYREPLKTEPGTSLFQAQKN